MTVEERNKRRWLAGRRHLAPLYNACPVADHSIGTLPGSRREVYETKLEETYFSQRDRNSYEFVARYFYLFPTT